MSAQNNLIENFDRDEEQVKITRSFFTTTSNTLIAIQHGDDTVDLKNPRESKARSVITELRADGAMVVTIYAKGADEALTLILDEDGNIQEQKP